MTNKIYRIAYTTHLYVLAETDEAARDVGLASIEAHVNDDQDGLEWPEEINSVEKVDSPWRGALPYGAHNERTIAQHFEEDSDGA